MKSNFTAHLARLLLACAGVFGFSPALSCGDFAVDSHDPTELSPNGHQSSPSEARFDMAAVGEVQLLDTKSWVVSGTGGMWRTRSGGEEWHSIDPSPAADVPTRSTASCFINEQVGFAFVGSAFFRTVDGGRSWASTTTVEFTPTKVVFIDEVRGWATGIQFLDKSAVNPSVPAYEGVVGATSDGGETWTIQSPERRSNISKKYKWAMRDLAIVGGKCGIAVGDECIFWTDSGGHKWAASSVPKLPYYRAGMSSESVGWASCGPGYDEFVVTRDGGRTWRLVSAPTSNGPRLLYVEMVGDRTLVVGGHEGVFETRDDGNSWNRVDLGVKFEAAYWQFMDRAGDGQIVGCFEDGSGSWYVAVRSVGGQWRLWPLGNGNGGSRSTDHPIQDA